MKYFLPDCDDRVDPAFDFTTDTRSAKSSWGTEVYAHELYGRPSCDGFLISRMETEAPKAKVRLLERVGVHGLLRIPRDVPVMGDCGAFGYAGQDTPPFGVADLVAYYTRLGFTYGASLDHIVAAASTEPARRARYEFTLQAAREFLAEHSSAGARWEPVGSVQGWDAASYAAAAQATAAMGYTYLALGGLVMRPTPEVLEILRAVRAVIPASTRLHLFGLARLEATANFVALGVTSADSTSPLRQAWLSSKGNYHTASGERFTALRVPYTKPGKTPGNASLERRCLEGLAEPRGAPGWLLDALEEYNALMLPGRPTLREEYRRTLEAAPWKACPCAVCRRHGVQVAIFRGNDRNRRRGFHNTWVWYEKFQQQLERAA